MHEAHSSSSILCLYENSCSTFAQAQFLHSEPRVKIRCIIVIHVVMCYKRKGYISLRSSLSDNVRFPVKETLKKESIRNLTFVLQPDSFQIQYTSSSCTVSRQKSVVSVLDRRHDNTRRLAQTTTANRYTTPRFIEFR